MKCPVAPFGTQIRRRSSGWTPLYAADPADSLLRFERIQLGTEDPDFWTHLAVDGERVLNLVDEYLSLGSDDDALLCSATLIRPYPPDKLSLAQCPPRSTH